MLLTKLLKWVPYAAVILLSIVLFFGASKYKKERAEHRRDKARVKELIEHNQNLLDSIQLRKEREDSLLIILSEGNQTIQKLEANEQQLKNKLNEKTDNIINLTDSELQDALSNYPKTRRRLN